MAFSRQYYGWWSEYGIGIMPNEKERALTFAAFAKQWREDADFRAEFEADPKSAIAARGGELIREVEDVRVVEDTEDTVHFVLPPNPNGAMSEQALAGVSGGVGWEISYEGFAPRRRPSFDDLPASITGIIISD